MEEVIYQEDSKRVQNTIMSLILYVFQKKLGSIPVTCVAMLLNSFTHNDW